MPRLSRQQGLLPTSVATTPEPLLVGCSTPYSGRDAPLHGDKFKLSDSSTWSEPVAILKWKTSRGVKSRFNNGWGFRAAAAHQVQLLRIVVSGRVGASVPQAHVVGLVRWRHALFGADMATLPPSLR